MSVFRWIDGRLESVSWTTEFHRTIEHSPVEAVRLLQLESSVMPTDSVPVITWGRIRFRWPGEGDIRVYVRTDQVVDKEAIIAALQARRDESHVVVGGSWRPKLIVPGGLCLAWASEASERDRA
jgi:hypothetical protein